MFSSIADSLWFTYVILPVLIILARLVDVSLGTLKIIFISRGHKLLGPILGFFEVLVWLLAITRIFDNLDNWICYVAYGLGYALGSYLGMRLEERIAIGYQLIRIITRKEAVILTQTLREAGHSVTYMPAEGSTGKVGILYLIVGRKSIKKIIPIIKKHNPNAFYTIEDIRFVSQPVQTASNAIKPSEKKH